MRRVLLVAPLLATTAGLAFTGPQSAHASTYLQCNDGFHQLRGKAGSNPPVSATVARQDDGRWSVVYVLRNGQTVMRESQYDIADKGNGVGWTGWRNGNQMRASIEHYNGRLIYAEAVYRDGEKLVGSNYIDCGPAPADEPDYAPPTQVSAPTPVYTPAPVENHPNEGVEMPGINGKPWSPPATMPSAGGGFAVALNDIPGSANVQYVNVTMGNGSVVYHMTLDTGCSQMSISNALADWMLANGHATFIRNIQSTLADGSRPTSRLISIDQISLEGHVLTDVLATDGAPDQADGSMLLGIGVSKRFGKFSIDTAGHQLVLG
jgi:hypothetical protein